MDTRSILIAAILFFAFAGVANAIWFGLELKRFLDRNPVLGTRLQMMRFKKAVAHQMYAALLQIVLLSIPPVIFVAGLMLEILWGSDFLFIVFPSAIILIVAAISRRWETQAKNMRTGTPEMAEERDAIVQTWRRKPWPDW